MSAQRLKAQFSTLYTHFEGKDTETTVQNMSDVLCCTHRNARIVLNKMMREGWIDWIPSVGRGHLSRLIFHRNDVDLQLKRVAEWINRGEIELAFNALRKDADYLTDLIEANLGFHEDDNRRVIRLPYYRALENLNPLKPLRKTERLLADQIFNRLTRFNPTTNEIASDLAYRWEMKSPTHWRFYLRPSVKFHDGRVMTAEDVIWSIKQAKAFTFFSHIEQIVTIAPLVLDFYLSAADRYFPATVSHHMLSIQPMHSDKIRNYDRLPIGTGAYRVEANTANHLALSSHETYFGFCALIDRIEIWPFLSCMRPFLTKKRWQNPSLLETRQHYFVEPNRQSLNLSLGSVFLLFNRRNGLAASTAWSDYLFSRLSPVHLLPLLHAMGLDEYKIIHSRGLMPEWMHIPTNLPTSIPPEKCRIRLVYQKDHPLFLTVAKAIAILLERDGIRLTMQGLSIQEIAKPKQSKQIDIWIGQMDLPHLSSFAFFAYFFDSALLSAAMTESAFGEMKAKMWQWRQEAEEKDAMYFAENCARNLIENKNIIPLFHSWVGRETTKASFHQDPQMISWCDFKEMW